MGHLATLRESGQAALKFAPYASNQCFQLLTKFASVILNKTLIFQWFDREALNNLLAIHQFKLKSQTRHSMLMYTLSQLTPNYLQETALLALRTELESGCSNLHYSSKTCHAFFFVLWFIKVWNSRAKIKQQKYAYEKLQRRWLFD